MQIIRVTEDLKDQWNSFVSATAVDGGILQSWEWGEFQKSLGKQIFRLGLINEEGQFQIAALLIKVEIHFDYNYLYCPRGPVTTFQNNNNLQSFFAEIKKIAKEEKSFLVKIDPAWDDNKKEILNSVNYRKADSEVQPKCSLIINISKSAEDVLSGMKQKTRYNINLAKKKGVDIRISSEISDIEPFWQLVKQTSNRDGINSHPKEYYKKMFELLSLSGTLKLFLAQYDNKIIAANMVTFFGNTCTYLHGASADMYRGVMAPYLLQLAAIEEASKLGLGQYDFGGINGQTYNNEKWEGITRFKVGFAPEVSPTEFVGSYDSVINPFIFSAYKIAKQIRG